MVRSNCVSLRGDRSALVRLAAHGARRPGTRPGRACLRALAADRPPPGIARRPAAGRTPHRGPGQHPVPAQGADPGSSAGTCAARFFHLPGKPVVSVVMVVRDQLPLTLAALASLRANLAGRCRADPGGQWLHRRHATYHALCARRAPAAVRHRYWPAARRQRRIAGGPRRDDAYCSTTIWSYCRARWPLRCAVSGPRIRASARSAARIIRPHGLLHEAGGIIWRDGSIQPYARDASPLIPEANFRRDVDYCSRIFLLVRTALLQQLAGFDAAFLPGAYEDVDLCARIWQAGFRVVYDPAVALYYMMQDAPPGSTDREHAQAVFCRKHHDWLRQRLSVDPADRG